MCPRACRNIPLASRAAKRIHRRTIQVTPGSIESERTKKAFSTECAS